MKREERKREQKKKRKRKHKGRKKEEKIKKNDVSTKKEEDRKSSSVSLLNCKFDVSTNCLVLLYARLRSNLVSGHKCKKENKRKINQKKKRKEKLQA